jgi:tetratricopeptide (TPR) repeat protein
MASANVNARRGERLKSWKEIAAFFGTDERTVRRWEERGLPVRRIPGGARATIYAEVAELESWMRGRGGASEETPLAARPKRRAAIVAGITALAAVFAAAAVSQTGWIDRAAVARHQPPQKAVDLYLAGTFDWEKRTPDSLQRARDLFGRAIAEDPAYAEPYAGLADTYLLLREYSVMPDAEAYPRAREAAERALALNPGLAQAHAALAFVTFFWTRDWPRGLAGFRRATELDPASASAWHWYGTALYHAGRTDEALRAIGEAQGLDPASRSIVADRALISYHAGHVAEAVAMLRQLAASDPEFLSPRAYLAGIDLAEGDDSAFVQDGKIAARLRGDGDSMAVAEVAEQGFRRGGRGEMLRTMLAEKLRLRRAGRGTDYELAVAYALLGESKPALRLLAASNQAGESDFVSVRMDPRLRGLHGDPDFRRLAAEVERPPPGRA